MSFKKPINGKVPDDDGIPYKHFKKAVPTFINKQKIIIFPIHEKGDPNNLQVILKNHL